MIADLLRIEPSEILFFKMKAYLKENDDPGRGVVMLGVAVDETDLETELSIEFVRCENLPCASSERTTVEHRKSLLWPASEED